jgi:hypothetical protein
MGLRSELQTLLETFCDHVYFQPPVNVGVEYPCIIYKRDFAATRYADNNPYSNKIRYLVTVIDRNPDNAIKDKVAEMPLSSYNRFYTADTLNHDVFHVYF